MSAIGIDLGTSNSCAAVARANRVEIIKNAEGSEITPSAVYQRDDGTWIVGASASATARASGNWEYCFTSVKRLIGRQADDAIVQEQARRAAYRIVPAQDGGAWVEGRKQAHACEEISALVLKKLKEAAEKYTHERVTKAVIAVPAHFTTEQTSRTKDAARIAGLEVLQMVSEPTAAALAYGADAEPGQTLAVFDLGAGTFDISIVQVTAEGIETLATAGDDFLGGDDFDAALVAWVSEYCRTEHGLTVTPVAEARIRKEANRVKHVLSYDTTAPLTVPYVGMRGKATINLHVDVTRELLESLTAPLIERCREPCARALEKAGLRAEQVGRLLLVGGQTQMPAVDRLARSLFPNARPAAGSPDKVVAQGAARLAAALDGGGELVLKDVTPHAISLEAANGVIVEVIPAQTRIPTTAKRICTTLRDDMDSVTIRLRQGADHQLGQMHLEGLRKQPAGKARVEVEISLDASGLVFVQASDVETGRKRGKQMQMAGGMDDRALSRLAKLHRKEFVDRAIDVPPEPEPAPVEEPPEPVSEEPVADAPEPLPSLLDRARSGADLQPHELERLETEGLIEQVNGEWREVGQPVAAE